MHKIESINNLSKLCLFVERNNYYCISKLINYLSVIFNIAAIDFNVSSALSMSN